MVLDQLCIGTRKLTQVLALPLVPNQRGKQSDLIYGTSYVLELTAACEALLRNTRALLLAEQYWYAANDAVVFLQEELASVLGRVLTGAAYTSLHSPADYYGRLAELGVPDLLAAVIARGYAALRDHLDSLRRR